MKSLALLALLIAVSTAPARATDDSQFRMPEGWIAAGSKPKLYGMGIDSGAGRNHANAATLKSRVSEIDGFGTLMQQCAPAKYLGKRVRFSAFARSVEVKESAGLWFRVDGKDRGRSLAFDNMGNRPIKGTTDWQRYSVVLDVAPDATNLAYGALLAGTGQIWFGEVSFETVDASVPTTDMISGENAPRDDGPRDDGPRDDAPRDDGPRNLDFSK